MGPAPLPRQLTIVASVAIGAIRTVSRKPSGFARAAFRTRSARKAVACGSLGAQVRSASARISEGSECERAPLGRAACASPRSAPRVDPPWLLEAAVWRSLGTLERDSAGAIGRTSPSCGLFLIFGRVFVRKKDIAKRKAPVPPYADRVEGLIGRPMAGRGRTVSAGPRRPPCTRCDSRRSSARPP